MRELNKQWRKSKVEAYTNQQGKCQICGEALGLDYVGHHLTSRKKGDNSVDNCVVRHGSTCEVAAHMIAKNGNPTKEQLPIVIALAKTLI